MQGNLQRARVIRSRKQKFTILDDVSGTLTPVSPFEPRKDLSTVTLPAQKALCQAADWPSAMHQIRDSGPCLSLDCNKERTCANDSLCCVQGRLTLLLGPPGSGKSTLLKALAGKLGGKSLRITGKITYNGETFSSFVPQRTAAYVSQVSLSGRVLFTLVWCLGGFVIVNVCSEF